MPLSSNWFAGGWAFWVMAALVAGCGSSDSGGGAGGSGPSTDSGAGGSGGSGGSGGLGAAAAGGGGGSCTSRPIVVSCTREGNGTKLCIEFTGTHYDADAYVARQCTTIGSGVATPNGTSPCDRSSSDYFGSCLLGCGSPDEQIVAYYTTVNPSVVCANQGGTWFDKTTPVW